jgi:hypothetical protein
METNLTTLSYRITHRPPGGRWSPARGFARAWDRLVLIAEAFAESRSMARQAQKRFPSAEW